MNCVIEFLNNRGYSIDDSYYTEIEKWIKIWEGKAKWLDVKTIDGEQFPMYSLGMGKRSCEDLASILTSEPYEIKATKNDDILQKLIKDTKLLEDLPEIIEITGCSGTAGVVARITNAEFVGDEENATLVRTEKTKVKLIKLKGNQIIPLTIENGEIINCAFLSEKQMKIDGKQVDIYYLEIHELEEKGYQVTNVYLNKNTGEKINNDNVLETYNTLSQTPLFALNKLPKVNPNDKCNGLGMALYGECIDQLQITDLTYNNFGQDFRLGQKLMLINRKLTRVQTEEYTDENGEVKTRQKVVYPTDIRKQQFVDITDAMTGTMEEKPYVYEYNPDLRVGDNEEGNQMALNLLSFKLGFGMHFYSFKDGKIYVNTESVQASNQSFVNNMIKYRKSTAEFLKKTCQALLLCEKILGANVEEMQEIEIPEIDGFLENDETRRQKLKEDWAAGAISTTKYLMEAYNMTEKEAKAEIKRKKEEETISVTIEDVQE